MYDNKYLSWYSNKYGYRKISFRSTPHNQWLTSHKFYINSTQSAVAITQVLDQLHTISGWHHTSFRSTPHNQRLPSLSNKPLFYLYTTPDVHPSLVDKNTWQQTGCRKMNGNVKSIYDRPLYQYQQSYVTDGVRRCRFFLKYWEK